MDAGVRVDGGAPHAVSNEGRGATVVVVVVVVIVLGSNAVGGVVVVVVVGGTGMVLVGVAG